MLYDKRWDVPATKEDLKGWQQALLDAAKILEEKGWCQGTTEDAHGRHCTLGAIDAAFSVNDNWDDYDTVMRAVTLRINHISIPRWNDSPARTKEQVIKMLRQAALR